MTSNIILALAVFGACCVEAVEALTLVVAAGSTRSWRSAFEGAATAFVLLVVVVGAVGPSIIHYVPIDTLRVIVGGLLLVLGLGWLRKAILRASGHKALHDEDLIYARTVEELTNERPKSKRDGASFVVAFKGVLLEGTEVVLIVLSLGASDHRLGLAGCQCGGRCPRRHRSRHLGGPPAPRSAGEHPQAGRRHHAHELRPLLGRRGGGP